MKKVLMLAVILTVVLGGATFAAGEALLGPYGPNAPYFAVPNNTEAGNAWTTWSDAWAPSNWFGVYDWGVGWMPGSVVATGPQQVKVAADVELWCEQHMNATQIYFHFADTRGVAKTQAVDGWFDGNNGQYLGFSWAGQAGTQNAKLLWEGAPGTSQCKGFILQGVVDEIGRSIATATIPCEVKMQDNGALRYPESVGDGSDGTEYAMWWLVNGGAVGHNPMHFEFTADPSDYQVDGHYQLDPTLVASPAL